MRGAGFSAVLPLLLLSLASCASIAAERARPWEKAWVWIPGRAVGSALGTVQTRMEEEITSRIPGGTKLPTIIYMHGCGGIDWDAYTWAGVLSEAGYAFIAPNSFAREYRPPRCAWEVLAGPALDVHHLRQEEIAHSIEQIQKLDWVDQGNMFLMGHSEGGIATAIYVDRERYLKGRIITGWTCTFPYYAHLDGVRAPRRTPLLSVIFENDPWFRNPWTSGNCESKFGGRENAKSVVLEGTGHSTAHHPMAREAVLRFLRENTSISP